MKIFLICPVREVEPHIQNLCDVTIRNLEANCGNVVHFPPRDTDQYDTTGLRICRDNREAIRSADVVYVVWDGKSQGCLFDLGMAFALGKPVIAVHLPGLTEGKSFQNMIRAWEAETITGHTA